MEAPWDLGVLYFDEREQNLSFMKPYFSCFAALGVHSGFLSHAQHHHLPTEQRGSRAMMADGGELIECLAAVLHCALRVPTPAWHDERTGRKQDLA